MIEQLQVPKMIQQEQVFQNKKIKTGTDVPKSDRTGVTKMIKMGTCVPFKKKTKKNPGTDVPKMIEQESQKF